MGESTLEGTKKKKKFQSPFRRRKKKAEDEKNVKKTEPTTPADLSALPRVVRVNSDVGDRTGKSRNGDAGGTRRTRNAAKPTKKPKLKPSWLARRNFFIKMADNAFDLVDADKSGEVDEKELYSGLLLIHLKLGCYAGPAACKPVDRERVHDIFLKMDADNSGSLDRDEFREVMMVLFSNVLLRVVVQWSMTLMIVPMIAQYILNAIYFVWDTGLQIATTLDEHSVVFDKLELLVESLRDKMLERLPSIVKYIAGQFGKLIDMIPDTVWNTIPLTLISCILGCIAVPWLLFKVDDYFQKLAHKKGTSTEVE